MKLLFKIGKKLIFKNKKRLLPKKVLLGQLNAYLLEMNKDISFKVGGGT